MVVPDEAIDEEEAQGCGLADLPADGNRDADVSEAMQVLL